jgi:hypothetical protein
MVRGESGAAVPAATRGRDEGVGKNGSGGQMISIKIIRRRGIAIAFLSVPALLAVACSSGGGPGATQQSPRHALLAAATQAQQMRSVTETLTSRVSGTQTVTTTGTILVQLKPALQLSANLELAAAGKTIQLKEIVTSKAIYLHLAALTRRFGKPWVKVDLSALKAAGSSLAQLYSSVQSSNLRYQTEILTVCKNPSVVRQATVGGVPTTEYACSVKAAQALKALRSGIRKLLGPELQAMGSSLIRMHIWIDRQNQIRKLTQVVTFSGETLQTTVTATAINKPVHITPPPASQTAALPGL